MSLWFSIKLFLGGNWLSPSIFGSWSFVAEKSTSVIRSVVTLSLEKLEEVGRHVPDGHPDFLCPAICNQFVFWGSLSGSSIFGKPKASSWEVNFRSEDQWFTVSWAEEIGRHVLEFAHPDFSILLSILEPAIHNGRLEISYVVKLQKLLGSHQEDSIVVSCNLNSISLLGPLSRSSSSCFGRQS